MMDILFYALSALAALSALGVVVCRNAVNGAMCLMLSLTGVAGIYLLLGSFPLFGFQILVYAGAIASLFLFVIMLLDVDQAAAERPKALALAGSTLAFAALLWASLSLIGQIDPPEPLPAAAFPGETAPSASIMTLARALLTRHMLPFQTVGFMLLVAMLSVVLTSRSANKEDQAEAAPVESEASSS